MARDVLILIGGASFGAIVVTAIIVRWPWLVFLKKGDS
jgi:hypothetical protein